MVSGPITSWQIDGEAMRDFILWGSRITANGDCSHEIKICLLLARKKSYDQPREHIKKQRHLPTKACLVKAMVFPVVMIACESWTIKKAECWRIDAFELCVVLETTLERPLDCKEIKPVHPKGNQSWIFIGGTDAEAETNILATWWKRWEEKGTTEDEMVGWHHWLNGREFG